jgi:hypothetical protein
MVGPKNFRARRRTKANLSKNVNTVNVRKWESSLGGIESAMNKIQRNRRVARCRARKQLKESPAWHSFTQEQQEQKEVDVIAEVDEVYDKQTEEARRVWEGKDEGSPSEDDSNDDDDEDEDDEDNVDNTHHDDSDSDNDESDPSFDGAADEPEVEGEFGDVLDHNGQRIIPPEVVSSFAKVWARGTVRLREAVTQYERHAADDEEGYSLSDSSDEDIEGSEESDNAMQE